MAILFSDSFTYHQDAINLPTWGNPGYLRTLSKRALRLFEKMPIITVEHPLHIWIGPDISVLTDEERAYLRPYAPHLFPPA